MPLQKTGSLFESGAKADSFATLFGIQQALCGTLMALGVTTAACMGTTKSGVGGGEREGREPSCTRITEYGKLTSLTAVGKLATERE